MNTGLSYQEEQDFKWMDEIAKQERLEAEHNVDMLNQCGSSWQDLVDLLGGSVITGKIGFVKGPKGNPQHEDYGTLTEIHVDQKSVGMSGDSFAGLIYAKVSGERWISIPYEC